MANLYKKPHIFCNCP